MSLQPGRLKTQKAPVEDSEKGPTCAYSNATDEELPMGPPKYIERFGRFGRCQITLLSFDLCRNCYNKNVVLFEENSILPLPERLEASGVESVWGEVSQESQKNR